ncbi:hypothetical protein NEIG_01717 [Nematocida sp. ERTm5]|nr:hypothetical protein NEIG_01717 [Nematocida sp. ERTm5]
MKTSVYWLLLTILEEIETEKKNPFGFGMILGTKLAEELALNELPEDTLYLAEYAIDAFNAYFECTLDRFHENNELHVFVKEESIKNVSKEIMELVAGTVTAIVERIQNKRIRIKTYPANCQMIISR